MSILILQGVCEMARRQRSADDDTTKAEELKAEEPKVEEPKVEDSDGKKDKRSKPAPLDRSKLTPEALQYLLKGEDAKEKMEVAAAALELLNLKAPAKRAWDEAARIFSAAEREARRIQKDGSKEEREVAKLEKKKAKITKLRAQLEELEKLEAKVKTEATDES